MDAVSEPSDERLDEEELLLERLLELDGIPGRDVLEDEELDGMDGIEAVEDEELEGMDGIEDDDEGEELGIEGDEDGEDEEGDELGMEGMPPLLLELCWVDSQPARTRASIEAPTKPALRVLSAIRMERRMEAAVFMVASLVI